MQNVKSRTGLSRENHGELVYEESHHQKTDEESKNGQGPSEGLK